jgi:hypothetical protein
VFVVGFVSEHARIFGKIKHEAKERPKQTSIEYEYRHVNYMIRYKNVGPLRGLTLFFGFLVYFL